MVNGGYQQCWTTILTMFFLTPQNKVGKGRVYLFLDGTAPRYPDFYKFDIVLDAKYKRYADLKLEKIDGDDLHQLITYMYILYATHGGFIVPRPYRPQGYSPCYKFLARRSGIMSIFGIIVDAPAENYKDYCQKMAQHEQEFVMSLPKNRFEEQKIGLQKKHPEGCSKKIVLFYNNFENQRLTT